MLSMSIFLVFILLSENSFLKIQINENSKEKNNLFQLKFCQCLNDELVKYGTISQVSDRYSNFGKRPSTNFHCGSQSEVGVKNHQTKVGVGKTKTKTK